MLSARSVVSMMAELPTTLAQLVQSRIDGADPQGSGAILHRVQQIVTRQRVGVGRVVAIRLERGCRRRQMLQAAAIRAYP